MKKNNEFAIKEVYDNASFEENAKVVKEVVELIQGYRIRYNKRQQYLSDFFELLLLLVLNKKLSDSTLRLSPLPSLLLRAFRWIPLLRAEKLSRKDGEIFAIYD
ncbi:MAG: hypothetical protein ACLUVG_04865 [Phocaeicola vulgatus]